MGKRQRRVGWRFRLAREFRRPDARRLLRSLSVAAYCDWREHFAFEPFAEQAADERQGTLAAIGSQTAENVGMFDRYPVRDPDEPLPGEKPPSDADFLKARQERLEREAAERRVREGEAAE
ncbi:phage tail assembly protein T [Alienimonas sp. DA493]|uniref:phage tail assembly protein T n=1 Tax=Alienimonas sp. DA493 TaxID=3373605 RepID=UPI003754D016